MLGGEARSEARVGSGERPRSTRLLPVGDGMRFAWMALAASRTASPSSELGIRLPSSRARVCEVTEEARSVNKGVV